MFNELYPAPWRQSGKILSFQKFSKLTHSLLHAVRTVGLREPPQVLLKTESPPFWPGRPRASCLRSEDELCEGRWPKPMKASRISSQPSWQLSSWVLQKPPSYRILKLKRSHGQTQQRNAALYILILETHKRIRGVIRNSALRKSPSSGLLSTPPVSLALAPLLKRPAYERVLETPH